MSLMIKDKELEEDIITAEKFNERRLLLQDLYNKEINNIEFIEFIEGYKMYYLTNCTICKNLKCKQNSNYSLTFFATTMIVFQVNMFHGHCYVLLICLN